MGKGEWEVQASIKTEKKKNIKIMECPIEL